MSQRSKTSSVAVPAPSVAAEIRQPHELECLIQRRLQTQAGLKFARLTVHQCPQGICLEGLLESNDEGLDLSDLVKQIARVAVINRVVMRPATPK